MKAATCMQKILLALAVLAFMGQPLAANTVHQHGRDNSDSSPAKMEVAIAAMAMDHHHHATHMDHTPTSDHKNNNLSSVDCCGDQCECGAAHCSTVYGTANERLVLLAQHLQLPQLPVPTLTLAHRTSPFRPPIA